jgi:hypothetical protein
MRERRTFGQWFHDARSRLVPAGCAVALFAVTAACVVAVVAPSLGDLGGALTGGAAPATATPATGAQRDQSYTLILPTAPASAIKLPRTPDLPNTVVFTTLARARMQDMCTVATPPAATATAEAFGTPTTTPVATTSATATATPTATATATATPAATETVGVGQPEPTATCQACPVYLGNNPDQTSLAQTMTAAAIKYGLPVNLVMAVAWQESRWHADVLSCDGGIGLMQIQYYTYPWLNSVEEPSCGLTVTNDDPYTAEGNADLGAKYLKWLSCFYSYWGDNGGASLTSPGQYTMAWYYQQAGLQYPDALSADGATNPNSFCAAVYNDPNLPQYAELPSTTSDVWSCPYSATTGDNTLLDMTLSAYNEGAGYTDQYGIQNRWYVDGVEGWIPQFSSGALPQPS